LSLEYKVRIPNSVRKDIEEIVDFYIEERPDYARRIFESISSRLDTLKAWPARGRVVPELLAQGIVDYRELIESHWRIMYRIGDGIVEVLTIVDARRNVQDLPLEKLKRKLR